KGKEDAVVPLISWNRLADSSMRSSRGSSAGRADAVETVPIGDLRVRHLRHHSVSMGSPWEQRSEPVWAAAWTSDILRQSHDKQGQADSLARCGTWVEPERQADRSARASACYWTHRLWSGEEDRSEKKLSVGRRRAILHPHSD